MTTRDGIIGRGLFEVFPDNPDEPGATGESNLRSSLNRVLQKAMPASLPSPLANASRGIARQVLDLLNIPIRNEVESA